jgi:hypothetical protein
MTKPLLASFSVAADNSNSSTLSSHVVHVPPSLNFALLALDFEPPGRSAYLANGCL